MSDIPDSVDCPECGQSFDPTKQGGWCTNSDCGTYKWEPESQATGSETTDPQPAATDPSDGGLTSSGDPASSSDPATDSQTDDSPGADEVECPNCGESVPNKKFCIQCGDELDLDTGGAAQQDTGAATEPLTCPDCGEEVEDDWAACINCGASLEDHSTADTVSDPAAEPVDPAAADTADGSGTTATGSDSSSTGATSTGADPSTDDTATTAVALEVEGSEIRLDSGDMIGSKVRTAHVQSGGDEEKARYVSREHALLEREGDQFYIVNKHQNGLELNGEEIAVDDREQLSDGDRLEFAGVVTAAVKLS